MNAYVYIGSFAIYERIRMYRNFSVNHISALFDIIYPIDKIELIFKYFQQATLFSADKVRIQHKIKKVT